MADFLLWLWSVHIPDWAIFGAAFVVVLVLWAMVGRRTASKSPDDIRFQYIDHIDGDPFNHDLSNLRIVDVRENRRRL